MTTSAQQQLAAIGSLLTVERANGEQVARFVGDQGKVGFTAAAGSRVARNQLPTEAGDDWHATKGPVAIDFAQVCQWSVAETFHRTAAAAGSCRRERFIKLVCSGLDSIVGWVMELMMAAWPQAKFGGTAVAVVHGTTSYFVHNGVVAEARRKTPPSSNDDGDGDVGSRSSGRWALRDGVIFASWSICTGHAGNSVPIAGQTIGTGVLGVPNQPHRTASV